MLLNRIFPFFPRAYPNDFLHGSNEDLPITDLSCPRAIGDYFFDSHSLYASFGERVLHLIQLEWLHNRFDHFHKSTSLCLLSPVGKVRYPLATHMPCMPTEVFLFFFHCQLSIFISFLSLCSMLGEVIVVLECSN